MNEKLLTKIIQSRSNEQVNIVADESISVGQKATSMFLKASTDSKAALFSLPLDLVELETLCASRILKAQFWTVC